MAKGTFTPTPLTFSLNGTEHTYQGRGRWSVELAQVVLDTKTVPSKAKDGTWGWREADADELASAQKLIDRVSARQDELDKASALRLAERAAAKAARREEKAKAKAAAKAERQATRDAARAAKAEAKAAKAAAKATKGAATAPVAVAPSAEVEA